MMETECKKFGRGPRELTGAVDLISHYKLLPHHDFFCKRSLPVSISDSHYLHNVVGDTEIRKGEGMQLGQLIQDRSLTRDIHPCIQPFDLDVLKVAFQMRESASVDLPPSEKGTPTFAGKSKTESKDKEKKHKKHKDKDRDKDKDKSKEHKKHKHRHKDRSKDKKKEKNRDKTGNIDSGNDQSKGHHEKKRKRDGKDDGIDILKHKKSKLLKLNTSNDAMHIGSQRKRPLCIITRIRPRTSDPPDSNLVRNILAQELKYGWDHSN